jgi:hypothetical protein
VKEMKKEQKPMNGTMVKNFEEMKEHGRAMEMMETNKELREKGKQPDPEQDIGSIDAGYLEKMRK